ncbi:MAG: DUF4012 domain-containing protein [Candidatus Magasanikbacteria bacterium]|nr:DUF4012 domain-containing protein [Candidatus Magasanikbacteria bacterium]
MLRRGKKPQLRACSVCNKPGHNKSRCPEFLRSAETKSGREETPIKMYLHEKYQAIRSPHIIELRHKENLWEKINSFSPSITPSPFQLDEPSSGATPAINPKRVQIMPRLAKPKRQRQKISFALLTRKMSYWREKRRASMAMTKLHEAIIKYYAHENFAPTKNIVADQPRQANSPTAHSEAGVWPLAKYLFWRTAIVVILLVIPFKASTFYQSIKQTTGTIAASGTEGFMALQESTAAIMQSDLQTAEDSVVNALDKFNNAVEVMEGNHRLLQKIVSAVPIVYNEVQSRQKLITAGQKIALGNTYLIKGLYESQQAVSSTLTVRVKTVTEHLNAAIPSYKAALSDLTAADPDVLPLEYQNAFKDFRLLFTTFLDDLENIVEIGKAVEDIFGGQGLRRYLIVFQNPHEIRPTGGFIGSFALLDIKDGQVVKLDIPAGGSYDLQGQLDTYVEPPTPLLLSNKRWEFQDSNWFADFPASAEKMLWFYRHSRKVTADGVIAINATVLERLLSVLGPVNDTGRDLTLTAANAIPTIQQIVEEGPEKKLARPKQVLSDLAPQFISLIYSSKPEQILTLMANLSEALTQKEIQTYFTDAAIEKTAKNFGWAGHIWPTQIGQDYLLAVNTNIQGQKTDAEIKQTISHQAIVSDDGTITDTVMITREHTGKPGEKLYGQTNIDYLRVYVPLGSKLISAGGFIWPDEKKFRVPDPWTKKDEFLLKQEKEIGFDDNTGTRITEEFGKTVFGNWLILEPGEKKQIHFSYTLPFKAIFSKANERALIGKIVNEEYLTSRFQLVVQKQSGQDTNFESQVIFPTSWHPSWKEGEDCTLAMNGLGINNIELKNDSVWSLLMRQDQ